MSSELPPGDTAGIDPSGRYARQILLPSIGAAGQKALAESSVAIVGCGALGCVSSTLLARAGVGRMRIIDRDFVETSNLQRQVLFDEDDVAAMIPKAAAAAVKLSRANPEIKIDGVVADLNPDNAVELLGGVSLIVDGTDNFEARFLVNDVSIRHDIPWIYGACLGSYGLTMNILPGETACLSCVMETAPPPGSVPTCDTAGVLGPIVSIVAGIQSAEAIKYLSGNHEAMMRDLVSVDAWSGTFTRVSVPKGGGRRRCATCDGLEFTALAKRGTRSATLCGRDAVQVVPEGRPRLDLKDLAARLSASLPVKASEFMLRFPVEGLSVSVFADGRAIVSGTRDPAVARGIYARYVGA